MAMEVCFSVGKWSPERAGGVKQRGGREEEKELSKQKHKWAFKGSMNSPEYDL